MATQPTIKKSTSSSQPYRFQRTYPGFITGTTLTVKARRAEPVRPFMQQGDMDGACGVHLVAMILAIFGLAKPSALREMSTRKFGVVADVWRAFSHTYFIGVHADEWVDLCDGLGLPIALTCKPGGSGIADAFAVDWLLRGDLVALAFASVKNSKTKHWALGVGIEGLVYRKEHVPDTLLLLDPSASEPAFSAFNARLRMWVPTTKARIKPPRISEILQSNSGKPITWLYEAMEWNEEHVQLLAAVRVRLRT